MGGGRTLFFRPSVLRVPFEVYYLLLFLRLFDGFYFSAACFTYDLYFILMVLCSFGQCFYGGFNTIVSHPGEGLWACKRWDRIAKNDK